MAMAELSLYGLLFAYFIGGGLKRTLHQRRLYLSNMSKTIEKGG